MRSATTIGDDWEAVSSHVDLLVVLRSGGDSHSLAAMAGYELPTGAHPEGAELLEQIRTSAAATRLPLVWGCNPQGPVRNLFW